MWAWLLFIRAISHHDYPNIENRYFYIIDNFPVVIKHDKDVLANFRSMELFLMLKIQRYVSVLKMIIYHDMILIINGGGTFWKLL
jgi:hypothetical protein